jgi:hypothetical protein
MIHLKIGAVPTLESIQLTHSTFRNMEVIQHQERRQITQVHASDRPPHACSSTLSIGLGYEAPKSRFD